MAKYGHLYEYSYALGGRTELCRTARPTAKANGSKEARAELEAKGWVLVKWLSGGGAYCHSSQLRAVGNEPMGA